MDKGRVPGAPLDPPMYRLIGNIPPRTNDPTQEINPDRNELNGKVPTKQQYTNCMIPVSMMYAKYASTIFNFFGVWLTYSS